MFRIFYTLHISFKQATCDYNDAAHVASKQIIIELEVYNIKSNHTEQVGQRSQRPKRKHITHLAPTRFASPSMFRVPMTFVLIVCNIQHDFTRPHDECQPSKLWEEQHDILDSKLGGDPGLESNCKLYNSLKFCTYLHMYTNKRTADAHLNRVIFVENWRGWACQMVNLVHFHQQGLRYICKIE